MNVSYDNLNTYDVAKRIGVAPQTITAWCRSGFVQAVNISDGLERPRYMFTEAEVLKIQNLIKRYGTRKWLMYSKQQLDKAQENDVKKAPIIIEPVTPTKAITEVESQLPTRRRFDADKVMDKIMELQDLKEALDKLDAERTQLQNEIEALRNEIMEVI